MSARPGLLRRLWDAAFRVHPSNTNETIWRELFGVRASSAGVDVTESEATQLSVVYACLKIVSESVSSLPLILYRRGPDDSKVRATKHPLYPLLKLSPNPEQSSMVFRQALTYNLALRGNGYAMVERDQLWRVKALWPLLPDRVKPSRTPKNELVYKVSNSSGADVVLPAIDVLHLRGLSRDGLTGLDPISALREPFGTGIAMQGFNAAFFKNGAQLGGYIEHPSELGDKAYERLAKWMESRHQGYEKAHKLGILEEGMKFHEGSGVKPEDAQLLESRKYSAEDLARIWRVPPHMLGMVDRGTSYASVEQMGLQFVNLTLLPILVLWEQELSLKLLDGSEDLFAEHLVNSLVRGDIKTRFESYSLGRNMGVLSANDIRRLENLNPIPAEKGGDDYLVPLNMGVAGAEPADEPDGPDPMDPKMASQARRLLTIARNGGTNGQAH